MAYVYRHIRLDKNEPFYIGIGSDSSYKRAYFSHNRGKYWDNIVKKCGYEINIIIDDLTWEEACKKEKEFIKLYGRKDLGVGTLINLTDGGDGAYGRVLSSDTKNKISSSNKGKKLSKETIEKLRNINKNKKLSSEVKEKISKANKGVKKPIGFGEKMSNRMKGSVSVNFINAAKKSNTGRKQSIERINERVSKLIGRKNSEESIFKMRESAIALNKCRKVICINSGVVYNSASEASRELGVNNIIYVCQGKFKQTKGLVFEYYEEKQIENLKSK